MSVAPPARLTIKGMQMSGRRSVRRVLGSAASALGVAALTACYAHTSWPTRSGEARTSLSAHEVVTAKEFARIVRQGTLMEALEQLRPSMLQARGGRPPVVSVDGTAPTDLAVLRTIPASVVREVRLQRASSNTGYSRIRPNGDVVVGDVIAVTTLGGARREW